MRRTQRDIRQLRKDVRAVRQDIGRMRSVMETEDRMENLIKEMKRSAREMLLMSREL